MLRHTTWTVLEAVLHQLRGEISLCLLHFGMEMQPVMRTCDILEFETFMAMGAIFVILELKISLYLQHFFLGHGC